MGNNTGSYIELNRRFESIDKGKGDELSIFESYISVDDYNKSGLSWQDILKNKITVILGEAGSGKTEELVFQSKKLRDQGFFSLFVRLEKLSTPPYLEALNRDEKGLFQKWIASNDPCYFFLDSVDESKLQSSTNFDDAIEGLIELIPKEKIADSYFIISSRFSDWNHSVDINLVAKLNISFEKTSINFDKKEESHEIKSNPVNVLKMLPLDREQVTMFSKKQGIHDVDGFLHELDSKFAWDLARRPLDVISLIEYYIENGELGNLYDRTKFDIKKRINRRTGREVEDQTTPERIKRGLDFLAATSFLTKKPNFKIPESVDPILENITLDTRDCLHDDWTNSEIDVLLSKSIFDAPSYSKIRFHHRSYVEFLASDWFRELFNKNCDSHELISLFIAKKENKTFIKANFKPIIAWLAIGNSPWNKLIRSLILDASPEIFLKYGDPNSLNSDYKLKLLRRTTAKFGNKERLYDQFEKESLSRLGDDYLTDFIVSKLLDNSISHSYKKLLLDLTLYGKIKGALIAVVSMILTDSVSITSLSVCINIVKEFGNQSQKRLIVNHYLSKNSLHEELVSDLALSFFPTFLKSDELLEALFKIEKVDRYALGIAFFLPKVFELNEKAIPQTERLKLLSKLSAYAASGQFSSYDYQEAEKYSWLSEAISTLLIQLLKSKELSENGEVIGQSLFMLNHLQGYRYASDLSKIEKSLKKVQKLPEVREAYSLLHRQKYSDSSHKLYYFSIFNNGQIIGEPKKNDFSWIVKSLKKSSFEDQKFLLKLLLDIRNNHFFSPILDFKIYKIASKDPSLKTIIEESKTTTFRKLRSRVLYKYGLYSWRYKLDRYKRDFDSWILLQKNKYHYYKNYFSIRNGNNVGLLTFIAQYAMGESSKLGMFDSSKVSEKIDWIITIAVKSGFKKFWRTYEPILPSEKTGNTIDMKMVIGLKGISLQFDDNEISLPELDSKEVELLIRYGINEFNGYSIWLEELYKAQPVHFKAFLLEVLKIEWNKPIASDHYSGLIHHVRYSDKFLMPIVNEFLSIVIVDSDPTNYLVLTDAINCLFQDENYHNVLIKAANKRLREYVSIKKIPTPKGFYVQNYNYTISKDFDSQRNGIFNWLIVLLQLDPENGLIYFRKLLSVSFKKKDFAESVASSLGRMHNDRGVGLVENPKYEEAHFITDFVYLIYKYVHPDDDIKRPSGVAYSPSFRDDAQHFRSYILSKMLEIESEKIDLFVSGAIKDPLFNPHKEYLEHMMVVRHEKTLSKYIWTVEDVHLLFNECVKNPRNDYELFRVAKKIFFEIKSDTESGDISQGNFVRGGDDEIEFRKFLKLQLTNRTSNIFTANQEVEIIDQGRPDIRIDKVSLNPISVEVKKADNGSFKELKEGLEIQLAEKYLKSPSHKYGFYILGRIDSKGSWIDRESNTRYNFEELIKKLQSIADKIVRRENLIFGIEVIGIDFEDR